MRRTNKDCLTWTWHEHLVPGQVYDLDLLVDLAVRIHPGRFASMPRKDLRTRIAEETDTGKEKVSQSSKQFEQLGRDERLYLGLPPDEVERQEALYALSRREARSLRGDLPHRGRRGKVRRALRGPKGANVRLKLAATRNRCGICGTHIYPAHPDSCELDHIVSLGNGGEDTLANTRPAHRYCNALLGMWDDEPATRIKLVAIGWPVDADAAAIATARAKEVWQGRGG